MCLPESGFNLYLTFSCRLLGGTSRDPIYSGLDNSHDSMVEEEARKKVISSTWT